MKSIEQENLAMELSERYPISPEKALEIVGCISKFFHTELKAAKKRIVNLEESFRRNDQSDRVQTLRGKLKAIAKELTIARELLAEFKLEDELDNRLDHLRKG